MHVHSTDFCRGYSPTEEQANTSTAKTIVKWKDRMYIVDSDSLHVM